MEKTKTQRSAPHLARSQVTAAPVDTLLYSTLHYYTILYSTVLYYTLLYCIVLHSTILYCTTLYFAPFCSTLLFSNTLQYNLIQYTR